MRIPPAPSGLPCWPPTALPSGLIPATGRLRDRLVARVGPDGGVRGPCGSRVLETALMLVLLDRTGLEPAARSRLAAYLSTHRDAPKPLDRLLARAALDGRAARDELDVEELVAQAPDFTGPRKRALLHAVLVLLGATPTARLPAPEAFSLNGLHIWACVQVTAVKVILALASGNPHRIEERDLELLRSTQRAGKVWEGNLLIHLSTLHALAPLPHQHRLVSQGIRTALEHQRDDGGMPFIRDEDTWVTATAGIALHAAAAPAPVVGAIARRLVRLQHPGGGWSYTDGARLADVDCTSVAIEVLHLAGHDTYRTPARHALDVLRHLRGEDGGFPTYLAGAPSEAGMTAAAVNALSTQGPAHQAMVDTALAYLASQQRPDGSFPPDWSSSRLHTVFRAALAAGRHPGVTTTGSPAQRVIQRAVTLVRTSQNPDGGWGQQDGDASDALSTAYALNTLSTQSAPTPAVARGVAYLLSQQRADGAITSIPDSIGPRPFGFAVPVLADIFALLALGHLTRRLCPAPQERTRAAPPSPKREPSARR
ncbi:prenyltransferase/squalene oxidase repeat-containing protein [Streptomyces sp. NBC_01803]|uniref:prenyltransferase/squalene oxidase repeat-containing protein n=1 Tax=Streptomyces sp. NBC_01803 TaxID=2975946 RepID=UPI002DD84CDA|nr:prenyltransferase/squalene oxidase repeat-containing protein [Streptomyces sp. NBC_01803]WSA43000.1 terpene cyclase/mutase family protein [Streptomyces sp. NBC_01803]